MFFSKKTTENPPEDLAAVTTIPPEFYAGQNPVVKFKEVKKEIEVKPVVAAPVITPVEKKLLDKTTVAGAGQPLHPANLLSNRNFLLIASAILFVVFVIGGIIYYWLLARSNKTAQPTPVAPKIEQPVVTPPVTVPEEEIPTTTVPTTTPTTTEPVTLQPPSLNFPSILSGDSADLDKDGVTDKAEELFKTDPSLADTDNDGFSDSHEIFYLYSPIDKAPKKLIDSGLVDEFDNPALGYKVYYPIDWVAGNVDAQYQQVLFSTLTGENIEIRMFVLSPGETFSDWFGQNATNERLGDLKPFESRFGEKGFARSDNLVFYFVKDNQVAVIIYHNTDDSAPINYRIVTEMMARSFRFVNNSAVLPVQATADEGMPKAGEIATTTL